MQEHGPYILETDGSLRYNDFSWNQVMIFIKFHGRIVTNGSITTIITSLLQYSNVVLYIESPSFVGFSHVSNHSRYRNAKKLARCATLYNSDSMFVRPIHTG